MYTTLDFLVVFNARRFIVRASPELFCTTDEANTHVVSELPTARKPWLYHFSRLRLNRHSLRQKIDITWNNRSRVKIWQDFGVFGTLATDSAGSIREYAHSTETRSSARTAVILRQRGQREVLRLGVQALSRSYLRFSYTLVARLWWRGL